MFEIDCNRYRIEQSVKSWAVQKLKNIDITFIIQWVLCLFHSQSGHWGGNHWPHHDCYNNPLHPYHKNRLHPTSRAQSTSEREREILHFCLSHELSSSDYWLSGVRLHHIQVFVIEFAYAGDSHFLLNVGWHNHGLCSAEERVSILRPQADIRNLNLKVGDGRSNSNDSFGECQPLGLGPFVSFVCRHDLLKVNGCLLLQQKVILEHHPKNYPLQGTCGVLGLKMCPFVYRHVLNKRKIRTCDEKNK